MVKHVVLVGSGEKVAGVQLAELQVDGSTRATTRRGVLGASSAGLAGFDSGSARTLRLDTSGA